ncbi:hypothetical protein M6D93_19250 [Jatrophihabitans telluris]|uniref:Glycerophosphoryl diester phosphodiesterase membrane domain-containing protein n=1 Tax=Jatrophihabitans telluris TaxID=2038343 RepID=A0ABY4QYA4_9ACTN|nr:hypothetical protein [Jatrophihabitans telluris]UQX88394.1 hypothetical protein M6D93_19250 [Jatrophihabitans telluris]
MTPPYGQPPYGQPPYGQPPYGQPPYGQPPYGQPDYYWQFAPKPGPVPLRPLNLGSIFAGSIAVIRRNPRLVLGLSALFATISAAASGTLSVLLTRHQQPFIVRSGAGTVDTVHWDVFVSSEGATLATTLIADFVTTVLAGVLAVVISQDVLGNRVSLAELRRRLRPKVVRLIILALLLSVGTTAGLLLCIAPGIWLWGIWALAVPALIVEDRGVLAALGRSRQLVSGDFWRVWGIRALAYLCTAIAAGIVGFAFVLLGLAVTGYSPFADLGNGNTTFGSIPVGFAVITGVGSAIMATFTLPFNAGVDVLLYVDQRMRKENMHVALQQAYSAQHQQRSNRPTGQP